MPINKNQQNTQTIGYTGIIEPRPQEIFNTRPDVTSYDINNNYNKNKHVNSQVPLSPSSSLPQAVNRNENNEFVNRPVPPQNVFQDNREGPTSQLSGNEGYYGNGGKAGNRASGQPQSENNYNGNGNSDNGQRLETSTRNSIEIHTNINLILPGISLGSKNTDNQSNQQTNIYSNNRKNNNNNNDNNKNINYSQENSNNGKYKPPLPIQNTGNNNSDGKKPHEQIDSYVNYQTTGSNILQSNKNKGKQPSISPSSSHNSGSGRPQSDRNNAMPNKEYLGINISSSTRAYESEKEEEQEAEEEEEDSSEKSSTKNHRYG